MFRSVPAAGACMDARSASATCAAQGGPGGGRPAGARAGGVGVRAAAGHAAGGGRARRRRPGHTGRPAPGRSRAAGRRCRARHAPARRRGGAPAGPPSLLGSRRQPTLRSCVRLSVISPTALHHTILGSSASCAGEGLSAAVMQAVRAAYEACLHAPGPAPCANREPQSDGAHGAHAHACVSAGPAARPAERQSRSPASAVADRRVEGSAVDAAAAPAAGQRSRQPHSAPGVCGERGSPAAGTPGPRAAAQWPPGRARHAGGPCAGSLQAWATPGTWPAPSQGCCGAPGGQGAPGTWPTPGQGCCGAPNRCGAAPLGRAPAPGGRGGAPAASAGAPQRGVLGQRASAAQFGGAAPGVSLQGAHCLARACGGGAPGHGAGPHAASMCATAGRKENRPAPVHSASAPAAIVGAGKGSPAGMPPQPDPRVRCRPAAGGLSHAAQSAAKRARQATACFSDSE